MDRRYGLAAYALSASIPDNFAHVQALCIFTGRACLACDKMDVGSICQYVADTLKQAESYDLLVLRSIVEDMTVASFSHSGSNPLECCACLLSLSGGHALECLGTSALILYAPLIRHCVSSNLR